MRRIAVLSIASLLAFGTPALAGWEDEISDFDRNRLNMLEEAKAKGLEEARGSGEYAAIQSLLSLDRRDASRSELVGNWRCRIMKLGGPFPAIVYTWFRCRVRETANGLYFEKLSGSQRSSGYLDPGNGGWVYLGTLTVNDEPQKPYSGANEGAGSPVTHTDEVAFVTKVGEGHMRMEFPFPHLESTFDVIELSR